MECRITVVVPCHNGENSLRRCVESVIEDAHRNKEIIIIENGSNDNSLAVANSIASQYPDLVQVLSNKESNANAARNIGIKNATGDYIQFLDCDDALISNKLCKSAELFRAYPELIMVYSAGQIALPDSNVPLIVEANHGHICDLASGEFASFTCALNTNMPITRLQYLKKNKIFWDEGLFCWQDAEFYFRLLVSVGSVCKVRHIPEPLFIRYVNKEGISSAQNSERYLLSQNQAVDKIYAKCHSMGKANEQLRAQWMGFKWLLFKRAVVGGCPRVGELVAPSIKAQSHYFIRRLLAMLPFAILWLGYTSFRFVRRGWR